MTLYDNGMGERRHKSDLPSELRSAREAIQPKLGRETVAREMGDRFTASALQRWELPSDNPDSRRIPADQYESLMAYYRAKSGIMTHGVTPVPRGTARGTNGRARPATESARLRDQIAEHVDLMRQRILERAPADEMKRLDALYDVLLRNAITAAGTIVRNPRDVDFAVDIQKRISVPEYYVGDHRADADNGNTDDGQSAMPGR